MGGKYTKAQAKATSEYMKDKHTFRVVVTKEKADKIKAHAQCMGESVNAYINRLIDEDMNGMKEACDAALKILKEMDQEEKGE